MGPLVVSTLERCGWIGGAVKAIVERFGIAVAKLALGLRVRERRGCKGLYQRLCAHLLPVIFRWRVGVLRIHSDYHTAQHEYCERYFRLHELF